LYNHLGDALAVAASGTSFPAVQRRLLPVLAAAAQAADRLLTPTADGSPALPDARASEAASECASPAQCVERAVQLLVCLSYYEGQVVSCEWLKALRAACRCLMMATVSHGVTLHLSSEARIHAQSVMLRGCGECCAAGRRCCMLPVGRSLLLVGPASKTAEAAPTPSCHTSATAGAVFALRNALLILTSDKGAVLKGNWEAGLRMTLDLVFTANLCAGERQSWTVDDANLFTHLNHLVSLCCQAVDMLMSGRTSTSNGGRSGASSSGRSGASSSGGGDGASDSSTGSSSRSRLCYCSPRSRKRAEAAAASAELPSDEYGTALHSQQNVAERVLATVMAMISACDHIEWMCKSHLPGTAVLREALASIVPAKELHSRHCRLQLQWIALGVHGMRGDSSSCSDDKDGASGSSSGAAAADAVMRQCHVAPDVSELLPCMAGEEEIQASPGVAVWLLPGCLHVACVRACMMVCLPHCQHNALRWQTVPIV